jgi:hypothetical protein
MDVYPKESNEEWNAKFVAVVEGLDLSFNMDLKIRMAWFPYKNGWTTLIHYLSMDTQT